MNEQSRNYKEVKMEAQGFDRQYKNPLTRTYQYEYALVMLVSELFEKVIFRSNITNLKLYFCELKNVLQTIAH